MERQNSKYLPAQRVGLTVGQNPFVSQYEVSQFQSGLSIEEALVGAGIPPRVWDRTSVTIEGIVVRKEYWHVVRPKQGTFVVAKVGPGDSEILRMVALIAVAVFATWATAGIANPFLQAMAAASIMAAGALAVNALIPLETLDTPDNEDRNQLYNLTAGQNRLAPYATMPIVLGKHLAFPLYAAKPYTEIVGPDQYLRLLFVVGYKNLNIYDMKLGETLLTNFSDLEYEVLCGGATDLDHNGDPVTAITLYPDTVTEDSLSTKLPSPITVGVTNDWVERTTEIDTDEFTLDLTCPNGLKRIDKSGDQSDISIPILIEYADVSVSPLSYSSAGAFSISGNTINTIRKGFSFTFPTRGQYTVRIARETTDQDNPPSGSTDQAYLDDVFLTAFRSIKDENPVSHTNAALIAIRIRATDQLFGQVTDFNCVPACIVPNWTGFVWTPQETSNPAALARYILQGSGNARALADDRLILDDFVEFYDECNDSNAPRSYNAYLTSAKTVWEVLKSVCAAGRSRPVQIDGKWSVVRDKEQTTIAQHFTPRNSWGFKAIKNYINMPHAWRMRFANEDSNYNNDERLVYDDGYSSSNATLFETLSIPGITNSDQVWGEGRYHLAVARLRPETFRFMTDFEHLVCTQGDKILFSHDAIKVGLGAFRINSVTTSGGEVITMTLDGAVEFDGSSTMVVRVRGDDGASYLIELTSLAAGLYETVTPIVGDRPTTTEVQPGDMLMFGYQNLESIELIIGSIIPNADLAAEIVCYSYNDAIYTADTGVIPAFESGISDPPGAIQPIITKVQSDEWVMIRGADGSLAPRILIAFGFAGNREDVRNIELQYRVTGGINVPWQSAPLLSWDAQDSFVTDVIEGLTYDLRARYITLDGSFGPFSITEVETVIGKTSPPPKVDSFTVVRQADGTREFRWGLAGAPPDLAGYEIRYSNGIASPLTDWGDMTKLHDGLLVTQPWETNQLAAGIYTIAIKGVDTSGIYSEDPLYITSSLGDPRIQNAVVYEDYVQKGWGGTKTNCYVDPDTGFLIPTSADTWGTLGADYTDWASWTAWNMDPTAQMQYEGTGGAAAYYDFGGVITVTPLITVTTSDGTGTITREVRYKDALGDAWSGWISVDAADSPFTNSVTTRYIQVRVTVDDPPVGGIVGCQVIMSADTINEYLNDWDMATDDPASPHVVGVVRIPMNKDFSLITSVQVALQSVGAQWSWELIDRDPELGPQIKVYDGASLADALIDVALIGLSGDAGTGTPSIPSGHSLLLETTDVLLLETGDKIVLETA